MSLLYTDNFDRADANPIGGDWSTVPGYAAGVISANAFKGSTAGYNFSYLNAIGASAAQWVEGTVGVGQNSEQGLFVRFAYDTGTNLCGFYCDTVNNWYGVFKILNGTVYQVTASIPGAPIAGTVVRMYVNGNRIVVTFNNVIVISVIDSSLSSGQAGLYVQGTTSSWDNFKTGDTEIIDLAGSVVGSSVATGEVQTVIQLLGLISGSSATSGGLFISGPAAELVGVLVGLSSLSGALTTLVQLIGSSIGAASLSGELLVPKNLSGSITSQAITSGALATLINLAGSSQGSGTLKDLFVARSSLPVILARVEQAERLTNSVEKNSFLFSISVAERRLNARVDKKSNSLIVTLQS